MQTFLQAKQAKSFWLNKLDLLNKIPLFILLICAFGVILLVALTKVWAPLRVFALFFLLFYLGNVLAVSLASGGSRYMARIDWLFVALALLYAFAFWNHFQQEKTIKKSIA